MLYTVTNTDPPEYSLVENDTTRSILQNVQLIFTTRKGTVPMYREFGLPMDFLDMPATLAEGIAVVEITDAIELFEPRAKLVGVDFAWDGPNLKICTRIEI